MAVTNLLVGLKISNQPVAGSIIVCASREYDLDGVLIVKGSAIRTWKDSRDRFWYYREQQAILLAIIFGKLKDLACGVLMFHVLCETWPYHGISNDIFSASLCGWSIFYGTKKILSALTTEECINIVFVAKKIISLNAFIQ